MDGIFFDFEANDIVIEDDGNFKTSNISSQNCAFISTSQVCRLTKPHIGEQLAVKLLNRKSRTFSSDINKAIKAVQTDGGKNVRIELQSNGNLIFDATYDN